MGSQDQTNRADLYRGIETHYAARQQARDEAAAPEREARERRMEADAKLHGTAGWSALSDARRRMAAAHIARQAQDGGHDAA
ncbi:hypothetical protein SSP531S_24650 [Streptomyces spongiicola]|uniref:Uncharacterized protein n=1 Tax=Streptomyces spongiicola TaxID=1690221 RepID=A0A388T1D2_9ACTN|nr:hypothetical protein [Streptomyces spongiicola]GBQ01035.1 hypothetical protein SSP531S_24650 [Streptomyces spongiicola]